MIDSHRNDTLSDEQFEVIHRAGEAFEIALSNANPDRIEDQLTNVADDILRPLFRKLLAIELEWWVSRGSLPQIDLYRIRFPEFLQDLEGVFRELTEADSADELQSNDFAQPDPETIPVPGYEIEGVLGRGGMGIVYKARHLVLKRTVALKMVLVGKHSRPRERVRFRMEAEAVARLQHPNIVQIHEVGEANGYPYCALEFVEGGNLASRLQDRPMSPGEAAKLVETLANAMQLAHSRNVVHRDLKPANILMTLDGMPKITDFGLARQIDDDSEEAIGGGVVGTPSYMAPEQASGKAHEAGPAADVYALGAILYDCLTGRPPFKDNSIAETLNQVRTQEPVPPSRLRKSVPFDLESICLKCLRKEPEHRYASASALANDLFRFQKGEPVLARPVGQIERSAKWVNRNPVVSLAILATALSMISGTTISYLKYRDANEQRRIAEVIRVGANESRDEALREQKTERWGRYRSNVAAASAALQLQNNFAARSALDDTPQEHRNWEWQYLSCQLDGAYLVLPVPCKRIEILVLSPSGQQIAVGSIGDNEIYLYDRASGKLDATLVCSNPPTRILYRPDGQQIASVHSDESVHVWDPASGRELRVFGTELAPSVPTFRTRFEYNRTGERIATFSTTSVDTGSEGSASRLWDVIAGKEITVLAPWQTGDGSSESSPGQVVFSPDGLRVAASAGEFVYLCDADSGKRLLELGPHQSKVTRLAYSPDGKRLASCALGSVLLWDGETDQAVAEIKNESFARFTLVQFSRDGARLVTKSEYPENWVRLWDGSSGEFIAALAGHKNQINSVAFSPDSSRMATASTDQTARLWDGVTGQLRAELRGHTGAVRHVVFGPKGLRLVTASDDATLRLWDARTGELIGVLRGHDDRFSVDCPPVFSPDGSRLISGSEDGTVRVWEINQAERNILRGHTDFVYDVAFSPNGEQVASASWDATARLWNATSGEQTGMFLHESGVATAGIVGSVAYHPDGKLIATKDRHRGIRLWDIATGTVIRSWETPAGGSIDPRVSFSPDGTLLATGAPDGTVIIREVLSGRSIADLTGHNGFSIDVAFHPNGNLLASAGADATVRLWDIATGSPLAVLSGHTGEVWSLGFSSDGKLLASASSDKSIRIWDPQSHQQLAVIPVGSIVYSVSFSPAGVRLAAGCGDSSIRLFDVASRQQVAELRGHTDYVHAVTWSPDGTRLVSGSGDTTIRVWDALSTAERAKVSASSSAE